MSTVQDRAVATVGNVDFGNYFIEARDHIRATELELRSGLTLGLGPIDSGLARKKAVYTPSDTPETSSGKTRSATLPAQGAPSSEKHGPARFRTRPRIRLMRALGTSRPDLGMSGSGSVPPCPTCLASAPVRQQVAKASEQPNCSARRTAHGPTRHALAAADNDGRMRVTGRRCRTTASIANCRPTRSTLPSRRRTFAKVQSLVFQRFFPAAGNVPIWSSLHDPSIHRIPGNVCDAGDRIGSWPKSRVRSSCSKTSPG
jgi:hypothetical protein